jgi:hypothetical protein
VAGNGEARREKGDIMDAASQSAFIAGGGALFIFWRNVFYIPLKHFMRLRD